MSLNRLLVVFCKLDYHIKTRLVNVTMGFGPSGKVEQVECVICKKIFIKKKHYFSFSNLLVLIIIILLIIILIV